MWYWENESESDGNGHWRDYPSPSEPVQCGNRFGHGSQKTDDAHRGEANYPLASLNDHPCEDNCLPTKKGVPVCLYGMFVPGVEYCQRLLDPVLEVMDRRVGYHRKLPDRVLEVVDHGNGYQK